MLAAVPRDELSLGAQREPGEVRAQALRGQTMMEAALQRLGVLQVVVQLDGSLAVLQRDAVSVVAQAAVHQDTEEAGMEGGQEVLALLRLDTDDPEVSLLLGGAL